MANNILSSAISKAALSITKVSGGSAVASGLKVHKVEFHLKSRTMRHRQEDGSSVVDVRIVLATHVRITAFIPDIETLTEVNRLMSDKSNLYNVTSKGIAVENVMVDADESEQSGDVLSATPVRISFKQVLLENESPAICEQAADSSVVNRGIVALNNAAGSVSDLATKIKASFNNIIGAL